MNLNRVIIVGNITRDPELKQTPSGKSVCSFSVATNRKWTDKDGQKHQEVEYHNVVAWGRTAELVTMYMKKGSQILVEGRLQTRSWEGKNGGKQYRTEIFAEMVQFGSSPEGFKDGLADGLPPSSDPLESKDLPF
jgi:single-strand DNA-binding protein